MSLGSQTVTVIQRVRGRHNEYVDGSRTEWPGCSVQPLGEPSESVNREQRTELRYQLFAPAGFRASSADVVEVVPGPLADDGAPARLALVGPEEPWLDPRGREHHVEALLRRRTG